MSQLSQIHSRRRVLLLAALIAFATAAAVHFADPASAARNSKVLGTTSKTPKPLCPKDCRATGSVTGFGVEADGKKGLYKAPADGHVVAWSVELSKPNQDQLNGFGELFKDSKFGTEPQAGLAILKRKGNKGSRYKLAKKTPMMPLESNLGEKPIFALDNPLRVKKGTLIGLTLPTWAPLFTDNVSSSKNAWKASRKSGECGADSVTDAKPQLRTGSTRTYGCKLTGERILYWAYFVPQQKKDS